MLIIVLIGPGDSSRLFAMTAMAGLIGRLGLRTKIGNGVAHIRANNHWQCHHQKDQCFSQVAPQLLTDKYLRVETVGDFATKNKRELCKRQQVAIPKAHMLVTLDFADTGCRRIDVLVTDANTHNGNMRSFGKLIRFSRNHFIGSHRASSVRAVHRKVSGSPWRARGPRRQYCLLSSYQW